MAGVQAEHAVGSGLTITRAPFIEQAQQEGQLYIHQPYELYSGANHDAWRRLFTRMEDRWRRYANPPHDGRDRGGNLRRKGKDPQLSGSSSRQVNRV